MLYKSMFTLLTYFTDCTIREKTNQLLTYVLVTQTDTDRDIQRDRQTETYRETDRQTNRLTVLSCLTSFHLWPGGGAGTLDPLSTHHHPDHHHQQHHHVTVISDVTSNYEFNKRSK